MKVYLRPGFGVVERFPQGTSGPVYPFPRMGVPSVRRGASVLLQGGVAMQLRDAKPHVGNGARRGLFGGLVKPDEEPAATILRRTWERAP